MKEKYSDLFIFLGILGLLSIVLHMGYMAGTSYECVTELPPKPVYYNEAGQGVYIGDVSFSPQTKCNFGFLIKQPKELT